PGDAGAGAARGGVARLQLAFPRAGQPRHAAADGRPHPGWVLARGLALRRVWARHVAALLAGDAPRRLRLHGHGPSARVRPLLPLRRHSGRAAAGESALRRLHTLAGPDGDADQPLRCLALRRRIRRGGRPAVHQRRRPRELPARALAPSCGSTAGGRRSSRLPAPLMRPWPAARVRRSSRRGWGSRGGFASWWSRADGTRWCGMPWRRRVRTPTPGPAILATAYRS